MDNVEILCKNTLINLCTTVVQNCANIYSIIKTCVKTDFSIYFSIFLHHFTHYSFSSISNQSFPLFHIPYNYYYDNYLIERI